MVIFKHPPNHGKPKQLLQIRVNAFDPGMKHSERRDAAVRLGVALCDQLQAGTMLESGLVAARDAKQGPREAKKRPAAAKEEEEEKEEEKQEEKKDEHED